MAAMNGRSERQRPRNNDPRDYGIPAVCARAYVLSVNSRAIAAR